MPAVLDLLWLLLGALLTMIAAGRWTVPAAAWLAPLALLVVTRQQPLLVGLAGVWLALFLASLIAYRGVIPVPGLAYPITIAAQVTVALLPFLFDRLLLPLLPVPLALLVFPLASTALEYGGARANPFGTWGAAAYTQYGNLPLMQLAAVTGLWGITFLIAWFGSVGSWLWLAGLAAESVTGGLLPFGLVLGLVLLGGGLRLARARVAPRTLRVAAIGWPGDLVADDAVGRLLAPDPPAAERAAARHLFTRLHDRLLADCDREAAAGARLTIFPEASVLVFADDEAALLERGRQLARARQVALQLALATIHAGQTAYLENKTVLITPAGEAVATYRKTYPVPGWEARASRPGDGRLCPVATPDGRLAAAICFDLDFPWLIRQAGRADADLLLAPASDWPAIRHLHHVMATFRAIENGLTLVRAARWGVSSIVDPYGRVVARLDHAAAGDQTLVGQAPLGRVTTLYSRVGDLVAWLCVAGLLATLGWATARALGLA